MTSPRTVTQKRLCREFLLKARNHIEILEGSLLPHGGVNSAVFTQRFCQHCLGGRCYNSFSFFDDCHNVGIFKELRDFFIFQDFMIRSISLVVWFSFLVYHGRKTAEAQYQVQQPFQVSWSNVFLSIHRRLWGVTSNAGQGIRRFKQWHGHWEHSESSSSSGPGLIQDQ